MRLDYVLEINIGTFLGSIGNIIKKVYVFQKESLLWPLINFASQQIETTNFIIHNCSWDEAIHHPIQLPKVYMEMDPLLNVREETFTLSALEAHHISNWAWIEISKGST